VPRALGPALGVSGLVVLVAGTFLPWLRSGHANRNSYAAGGAMQRLLGLHGLADTAISAWPAAALVCAAVVAIFTIGLRRCAAALAVLAALAAGAVALAVLRVDGNRFVKPATLGPAVTLIGAAVVLAAAGLVLASTGAGTARARRAGWRPGRSRSDPARRSSSTGRRRWWLRRTTRSTQRSES
jgi:hypothetical protein